MVEFLDKHRLQKKFEIYEAHQIFEWFKKPQDQLSESEKSFTDLIRKAISAPEASQTESLDGIKKSFLHLTKLVEPQADEQTKEAEPMETIDNSIKITQ